MLSILITSYKEPRTIGRAIAAFLSQIKKTDELLVAAPDEETYNAIKSYTQRDKRIKAIKDKGEGKPAALNLLLQKAKGDIFILSDGDVFVAPQAVHSLLKPFSNPQIGAVTGRPVSLSPRTTLLGFWSHLLTDIGAHKTRLDAIKKGKFIVCSGYLYALRKGIVHSVPEDALSDDAVISTAVSIKGWKIAYTPHALVYVSYPTTIHDWIIQKRRSTGGYTQLSKYFTHPPMMRSFWREALGSFSVWTYPKSAKEMLYVLLLFPFRLYIWFKIYVDIVIIKKKFKHIWVRVESTK